MTGRMVFRLLERWVSGLIKLEPAFHYNGQLLLGWWWGFNLYHIIWVDDLFCNDVAILIETNISDCVFRGFADQKRRNIYTI